MATEKWKTACRAHPEDGEHECNRTERRCVYCGVALEAYPCRGCGDFLTAFEMHSADRDGIHRCRRCC